MSLWPNYCFYYYFGVSIALFWCHTPKCALKTQHANPKIKTCLNPPTDRNLLQCSYWLSIDQFLQYVWVMFQFSFFFSGATNMSNIWTLFDANGTEPWLASQQTPAVTQLFQAKMAAGGKGLLHLADFSLKAVWSLQHTSDILAEQLHTQKKSKELQISVLFTDCVDFQLKQAYFKYQLPSFAVVFVVRSDRFKNHVTKKRFTFFSFIKAHQLCLDFLSMRGRNKHLLSELYRPTSLCCCLDAQRLWFSG